MKGRCGGPFCFGDKLMAGTLFGLALSQQHDADGKPLAGGKLYIFQAGTQVPLQAYRNFGLSVGQEHPHPIVLDSRGRVPAFWLADGTARARLTTATGEVHFDEDMVVLGPSIDEGGGGGDTTNPNALPLVGDFDWQPRTGTRTGWVRANARTIGSATSGATERAHADCELLFTTLWNRYADTICPVVGGRGASAAADWPANKQLTLPDGRARAPFGVADMGNSDSGRLNAAVIASGSATAAMSVGGADRVTLAESEMPVHTHVQNPHNHGIEPNAEAGAQSGGDFTTIVSVSGFSDTGQPRGTTANGTATNQNAGGGAAHNNMPPFMLGTWYIFLG
jgi:microcystin-dependent protein